MSLGALAYTAGSHVVLADESSQTLRHELAHAVLHSGTQTTLRTEASDPEYYIEVLERHEWLGPQEHVEAWLGGLYEMLEGRSLSDAELDRLRVGFLNTPFGAGRALQAIEEFNAESMIEREQQFHGALAIARDNDLVDESQLAIALASAKELYDLLVEDLGQNRHHRWGFHPSAVMSLDEWFAETPMMLSLLRSFKVLLLERVQTYLTESAIPFCEGVAHYFSAPDSPALEVVRALQADAHEEWPAWSLAALTQPYQTELLRDHIVRSGIQTASEFEDAALLGVVPGTRSSRLSPESIAEEIVEGALETSLDLSSLSATLGGRNPDDAHGSDQVWKLDVAVRNLRTELLPGLSFPLFARMTVEAAPDRQLTSLANLIERVALIATPLVVIPGANVIPAVLGLAGAALNLRLATLNDHGDVAALVGLQSSSGQNFDLWLALEVLFAAFDAWDVIDALRLARGAADLPHVAIADLTDSQKDDLTDALMTRGSLRDRARAIAEFEARNGLRLSDIDVREGERALANFANHGQLEDMLYQPLDQAGRERLGELNYNITQDDVIRRTEPGTAQVPLRIVNGTLVPNNASAAAGLARRDGPIQTMQSHSMPSTIRTSAAQINTLAAAGQDTRQAMERLGESVWQWVAQQSGLPPLQLRNGSGVFDAAGQIPGGYRYVEIKAMTGSATGRMGLRSPDHLLDLPQTTSGYVVDILNRGRLRNLDPAGAYDAMRAMVDGTFDQMLLDVVRNGDQVVATLYRVELPPVGDAIASIIRSFDDSGATYEEFFQEAARQIGALDVVSIDPISIVEIFHAATLLSGDSESDPIDL